MLQEKKIQTIFDEHFPKQVLPSPVALRIKQQMQQQLQANRQASPVTSPARQRQKFDLRLTLWQWWDNLQFQPVPSLAMAGATAIVIFSTYFLTQATLLNGLEIGQPNGNVNATTVIINYEDFVAQTNVNREPEVALIIPTIDDMRLSSSPSAPQAVAIADTSTPMPIMPTSRPEIPSEQIILKPTSTREPTPYPVAMDIPPAILENTPTQSALAVALENILPTPMAQMPTPNHDLAQADIIIRPTTIPKSIAPAPVPTATFVPTVLPLNLPNRAADSGNISGIIGEGPSVPQGIAVNRATATAQVNDALSVINQVPTLLPPSQIVASPLSPVLPTATPVLPTPVLPTPVLPIPALPIPALPTPALPTPALPTPALPTPALPTPALPTLVLPTPAPPTLTPAMDILPSHTPTAVPITIVEERPTEFVPAPTLLPTFTLIPTDTPRPPDPTDTPKPPSNHNNSNNKNNRDENRGNRADPQPTATPIPQIVHVPVEPPTAPPPIPTAPPATAAPAPIPPTKPPVQQPTQPPPTQPPPTQPPPTATLKPVHTATSAPTKRPPTSTPARVEIKPIVGVPEPTAKPTAIVQLPTSAPEPVRESGKGADPVSGKDSNPVKPVFTPTSPPDRTKPTPMRVEIKPVQESPKAVPTLTPRPTSKPIVLDSEAASDSLLGHDEGTALESAAE